MYIMEETTEALARELLFLLISVDKDLGIPKRVEYFLEIHGNQSLREEVHQYLLLKCRQLLRFVIKEEGPLSKYVDLSHLSFRERHDLEVTISFWKDEGDFKIDEIRTHRMKEYYGERYDARSNLVDWDYYMVQKGLGTSATIIHYMHYSRWRLYGQAFEVKDGKYTQPNRTLCSIREATTRDNKPIRIRGYWGDIVVSPHVSYGVESDYEDLFEMRQKQHVKNSFHVSEENLTSYLYEWMTGREYTLDQSPHRPPASSTSSSSSTTVAVSKKSKKGNNKKKKKKGKPEEKTVEGVADLANQMERATVNANGNSTAEDGEAKMCDHVGDNTGKGEAMPEVPVKIILLSSDARQLFTTSRYRGLFHRAIVSNSHLHLVNKGLNDLLLPGAVVSLDTIKYVPVDAKIKQQYALKLVEIAESQKWDSLNVSAKKALENKDVAAKAARVSFKK